MCPLRRDWCNWPSVERGGGRVFWRWCLNPSSGRSAFIYSPIMVVTSLRSRIDRHPNTLHKHFKHWNLYFEIYFVKSVSLYSLLCVYFAIFVLASVFRIRIILGDTHSDFSHTYNRRWRSGTCSRHMWQSFKSWEMWYYSPDFCRCIRYFLTFNADNIVQSAFNLTCFVQYKHVFVVVIGTSRLSHLNVQSGCSAGRGNRCCL